MTPSAVCSRTTRTSPPIISRLPRRSSGRIRSSKTTCGSSGTSSNDETVAATWRSCLPVMSSASHGKSRRFLGCDEIHGYRTWDILEAMQPDPYRPDAQQWITSYASLFHRPGVPLFDLMQIGKAGSDPRMLFSWYAANYCTDPDFAEKSPEERANPSMASWGNPGYLAQQQRRLPAHKYRRLHLNLPGLPEGSAYQPEPIFDAIARGVKVRAPQPGIPYTGFVDMSGGATMTPCSPSPIETPMAVPCWTP